jgi:hypothetical protein
MSAEMELIPVTRPTRHPHVVISASCRFLTYGRAYRAEFARRAFRTYRTLSFTQLLLVLSVM